MRRLAGPCGCLNCLALRRTPGKIRYPDECDESGKEGDQPHIVSHAMTRGKLSLLPGRKSVHIFSTVIRQNIHLAVRHYRQVEAVVIEKDVPLITVPKQEHEPVSMAIGVKIGRVVCTKHS